MGMFEIVVICGVLPALWVWLLCSPTRQTAQKVAVQSAEGRDWRDDLNWRE